jgi:hypothetical protein
MAAIGALWFASAARADPMAHVDQLALDIQSKAGLLMRETRHYVHTPEYQHLREDALRLRRLANHVHQIAHQGGSVFHLNSDLVELDRSFRHIQSLFDRIESSAQYGVGHVHGPTEHVRELLCAIEECIRHMQDDVRELLRLASRSPCGWSGAWAPHWPRPGTPGVAHDRIEGWEFAGSLGGLAGGRHGGFPFEPRFRR